MVTLQGHGFILRPYRKGDELSLQEHINDREIAHNTLTIPYPYTLKDAKQWIGKCLKDDKKKVLQEAVFALTVDGAVVGSVALDPIALRHKAELGYWLGRKYWGRGMMTQAVNLVVQYGFQQLQLTRIYAYVFPFNKASARVLEKAGFSYEGLLRSNALKDGKPQDDLVYAILKQ